MTQRGSALHRWLFHGSLFFTFSCGGGSYQGPGLRLRCLVRCFISVSYSAASVHNTSLCLLYSIPDLQTRQHQSSIKASFTDLYVSFNEGREGGTGLRHVVLREGPIWISTLHRTLRLMHTICSKGRRRKKKLQTPSVQMKDRAKAPEGSLNTGTF